MALRMLMDCQKSGYMSIAKSRTNNTATRELLNNALICDSVKFGEDVYIITSLGENVLKELG